MHVILEQISKIGIVPVIKIDDAQKAAPLAMALIAGGIPCAEETFRTAAAEEAIRFISSETPDILVGAGTVLSTEQVDKAVSAGAKFIVTPGLNPKVVAHCISKGVPIIPGCSNPSDIEAALEAGLEVVKFFPAEQTGGIAGIQAISAPYPTIKFIPTGGINANNVASYLRTEKVIACGGTWMVKEDLISAGNFDAITAKCKEAVTKALDFTVVHVGINRQNEEEALKTAILFETLFGFSPRSTPISFFAGDRIEITKSKAPGAHGHIAVGVAGSVERGVYHLERRGFVFDKTTERRFPNGSLQLVYLKDHIADFAIHLAVKR
jgi:2-dehydro-3-deoxyphosphogluconate aldolase/(4S)-4-hydroxy-2-oxoglutarate aldolase